MKKILRRCAIVIAIAGIILVIRECESSHLFNPQPVCGQIEYTNKKYPSITQRSGPMDWKDAVKQAEEYNRNSNAQDRAQAVKCK